MNRERLSGNWKQLRGKLKEQWGRLIGDELHADEGKMDQVIGRIQERYGKAMEKVERQVRLTERNHGPVASRGR
jgi:uncharacterized protein YjbJ (UPF0337 family)